MSLVIAQTSEELQASLDLHSKAELRSILLASAKAERGEVPDDHPDLEVRVRYRPVGVDIENLPRLVVAIEFECTVGLRIGAEAEEFAGSAKCMFQARYSLVEGFKPTKKQALAFVKGNAVMNCWPYMREFVQNMFGRMGVELGAVPFLRLVSSSSEAMLARPAVKRPIRKKKAVKKS